MGPVVVLRQHGGGAVRHPGGPCGTWASLRHTSIPAAHEHPCEHPRHPLPQQRGNLPPLTIATCRAALPFTCLSLISMPQTPPKFALLLHCSPHLPSSQEPELCNTHLPLSSAVEPMHRSRFSGPRRVPGSPSLRKPPAHKPLTEGEALPLLTLLSSSTLDNV